MSAQATTTADQRDERLARLLGELAERARLGQPHDVAGLVRQHPDLGDELRELWAAAQFAAEFAAGSGSRSLSSASRGRGANAPAVSGLTGRTFGDFELLEELGRGGMGVVYKAWQKSLNRLVALKMILRGEHATPADLARFQVEAHAAAHLEHPNIVPVYAAGEHDSQAYFSMRLVEGDTLTALLSRGPMRPRDAAALLAVISRAIDFAHQAGILHRDIKPSNILIDRAGQPHVTDFGLAKRVHTAGEDTSALTQSGAIVGSPAYMPRSRSATGAASRAPRATSTPSASSCTR